jgi:hypothetical protein
MPGISVSKIPIPFNKGGGISWSSYWATLISATVENAAPTHVVLTFPTAQTSLGATDFTIAGFTIASGSWTGAVLTLVLSEAVMIFDGNLTITFVTTGETATVTNNVDDDGNTAIWLDSQDLTSITKDESNRVAAWNDKLLQVSDLGAEFVINGSSEAAKTTTSVYRVTTTQSSEQAHNGTYSTKVTHTAAVGNHRCSVSVTGNKTYRVSVWVYLPSGQAGVDSIMFMSGGAGNYGSISTKDEWVELTATFLSPYTEIDISAGSSSSENQYWYFDDFSIKEVTVTHQVTQEANDKKPIWSDDGITFDGTDDYLQSRPISIPQPSTIYAVLKLNNTTGSRLLDSARRSTIGCYTALIGDNFRFNFNNQAYSYSLKDYNYIVLRIVLNGASTNLRLNNYEKIIGANTANLDGLTVGASYVPDTYSSETVREIIVRNGIDTEENYEKIYNYLINKHYDYIKLVGDFIEYSGNPVISPVAPDIYATFASVLKVGNTFYMYYHSDDGIDRALSSDGYTWSKDESNSPIMSHGSGGWDNVVGVPMVWVEDNVWYMIYRGNGAGIQGNDAVGLATSSDGITWTRDVNNPVIQGESGEWDNDGAEAWGVIKVGITYYLYYEAGGVTAPRRIGIATSTDLINWTKDVNNPIFENTRFCPFAFKYEGSYYLLVPHGSLGDTTISGSNTEIELYKDASPTFYAADREFLGVVKKRGGEGRWDTWTQDTPVILTDNIYRDSYALTGGKLIMYYSGRESLKGKWAVGILESDGL